MSLIQNSVCRVSDRVRINVGRRKHKYKAGAQGHLTEPKAGSSQGVEGENQGLEGF